MPIVLKPARLGDTIANGTKTIKEIQNKQKSVEVIIRSTFKVIIEALLQRQEVLLAKAVEIGLGKQTAVTMQGEVFDTLCKDIDETCEKVAEVVGVYTPAEMLSVKEPVMNNLQQLMRKYQCLDLDPCRSDVIFGVLDTSVLLQEIRSFGAITGGSYPSEAKTDLHLPRAVVGKQKSVTVTACMRYAWKSIQCWRRKS